MNGGFLTRQHFRFFYRIHHTFHGRTLFLFQPREIDLRTSLVSNKRNFSAPSWPTIICASTPVLKFQEHLVHMHDISDQAWWLVILLTTLGIRIFVTFPFTIYHNHIVARLENLNNELSQMAPELKKEVSVAASMYNWDVKTSKSVYKKTMKKYYTKFVIRDNCHPFKCTLLAVFQIPVWICFSASLRNLSTVMPFDDIAAEIAFTQLKSEGILWFKDLTTPDMFLIPVLLAAVNLTLIEIHGLRKLVPSTLFQKVLRHTMRIVTIAVAIVAAFSPSAVSFYWLCSSSVGLGQNILFMLPKIRRMLRIPITPSESVTPFKDIVKNFKTVVSK